MRREHADDLAQLRDLAETNLAIARDDTEFLYGLHALVSFEDCGVCGHHFRVANALH